MKKKTCLIIYNPRSGKGKVKEKIDIYEKILKENGYTVAYPIPLVPTISILLSLLLSMFAIFCESASSFFTRLPRRFLLGLPILTTLICLNLPLKPHGSTKPNSISLATLLEAVDTLLPILLASHSLLA